MGKDLSIDAILRSIILDVLHCLFMIAGTRLVCFSLLQLSLARLAGYCLVSASASTRCPSKMLILEQRTFAKGRRHSMELPLQP